MESVASYSWSVVDIRPFLASTYHSRGRLSKFMRLFSHSVLSLIRDLGQEKLGSAQLMATPTPLKGSCLAAGVAPVLDDQGERSTMPKHAVVTLRYGPYSAVGLSVEHRTYRLEGLQGGPPH